MEEPQPRRRGWGCPVTEFVRITNAVSYRPSADWGVDAAYLKGTARIYPEQWTISEMRAILTDMENRRAPSAPAAGSSNESTNRANGSQKEIE